MMVQIARWFGLILIGLLPSVAPASGFGVFETGQTPLGSAGAFVARAEDGSALFINPAGLAQLDRREFALSVKAAFQASHYSNAGQTTWDSDRGIDGLPHFVFHDQKGRLGYGLGITTTCFYDLDWDDDTFPGRFLSTGSTMASREWVGGAAFRISDRFSLGASLRFVETDYDISRRIPQLADDTLGGQLIYEVDDNLSGSGDDVGFCVAAQYYKNRWLSMGFAYHSGMEVDLTGNRSFALASRTSDARVLDAFAGSFSDSSMDTRVWLPARFSLGFATKVTVRTRLEIDAEWEDWSKWESSRFVFDSGEESWVIPRDMNGVFTLKVSGDFQHRKNLLWRIGLAIKRTTVDEENVEPSFPDADRFSYSGGVSYTWNEWVFEAAYMYHQYRDTEIRGQEFIISIEDPDLIVSTDQKGLFETQKHQFSLGVRRRF